MNHDLLWQASPERLAATRLTAFAREMNARFDLGGEDYGRLWQWSLARC